LLPGARGSVFRLLPDRGQRGQLVTQASLRGKVVLLTFLDPACRADCPPAGPEFRQVTQMLGGRAGDVDLVGVSSSLAGRAAGAWPAFDRRQGLNRVPGWLYLTGTPAQLRRIWREYGITAAGRRYAAFVIDPIGRVRQESATTPGRAPPPPGRRSPCCSPCCSPTPPARR
jgi:cytochrome oxidase Cu insertion factor (SCO1/SenC/PrrC family)